MISPRSIQRMRDGFSGAYISFPDVGAKSDIVKPRDFKDEPIKGPVFKQFRKITIAMFEAHHPQEKIDCGGISQALEMTFKGLRHGGVVQLQVSGCVT